MDWVGEYLSRKSVGGILERKRLREQIGADSYAADISNYAKAVGDGGDAFASAAGFDAAKKNAASLLSRTQALQEYIKRYGGDATGLEDASKWLTSTQEYFDRFADYADYDAQKKEYERLSQNYDFEDAAKRLDTLKESEKNYPSNLSLAWDDLKRGAGGEYLRGSVEKREELQAQIKALEDEIARARYYEGINAANLPDFEKLSAPVTTNPNRVEYGSEGSDTVDWKHEYINDGFSKGAWYTENVAPDGGLVFIDKALDGYNQNVYLDTLAHMSEDEVAQYNYLYNTKGKGAAEQYLQGVYSTLYARAQGEWNEWGKEHPFLGTLGSVGMSLFGGVEEVDKLLRGDDQRNFAADSSASLRSGAASNIESDFGRFLYNTGVSGLDSLVAGVTLGPVGGVALGLSAMASTRNDLLRRGADPETALKAGIAAGIFEGLFETLSLGQLKALKEVPVHQFKDLALNFAKSAGVNASEEAATEIANILYDTIANGDFSEAQQMLDQGMSKGEIAKKFLAQIGEAAASGAVMGVGFAGIGSTASGISSAIADKRVGRDVKTGLSPLGSVDDLVTQGKQEGVKQTARVEKKGEGASDRAVGDLHRRVASHVATKNQEKTKKAIASRFEKIGVNENREKLATVVLKKYLKIPLSWRESVMLEGTPKARQVLRELEGEGNARWVNELLKQISENTKKDDGATNATDAAEAVAAAADIPSSSNGQVQDSGTGATIGARPAVVSVKNNALVLAGADGTEINFSDTAMPQELAELYSLAGLFHDTASANDFVQNWDGKVAPDAYYKAYDLIRLYGRNHAGYTDAEILKKGREYGLSDTQTLSAFKSGMTSLAEERRAQREKLEDIARRFRESGAARKEGKYDASGIRGLDLAALAKKHPAMKQVREYISFLRLMSQAFGMNVRVVANPAEGAARGSFNPATNTLTFNIYAGTAYGGQLWYSALPNVISHESVHWMRLNAPEEYAALEDMVFDALKKTNDYDFAEAVQKEFGKYQERYGREITDAQAREEIVARACEDLFGRSEALQGFLADFAEKNKKAANKFVAAVKKILDNIKKFFGELLHGVNSRTAEAAIIRRCGVESAKALQAQFDKTFLAAMEGNAARNALGEMELGGEMFADEEDYAEYDKPITKADVDVLRSIGRKSVNEFSSEEIKKAQKWAYKFHKELGVKSPFFRAWFGDWRANDTTQAKIVDIPNAQQEGQQKNPVCKDTGWSIRVSGHGKRNTRAHAGSGYLSVLGLNNVSELIENAVLLDTEIHEHHDNNAPNEMVAFDHKFYALGKSDKGGVALYKITVEDIFQSKSEPSDLRFHNLRYVKEIKKVAEDTSGSSNQSDRPYTAKSDTSTTTYSISDLFAFVKQYDAEFSPKPVNEAFLNEDGTPKVFYHGTDAEWTTYDLSKNKNQMWGDGIYLTPDPERARLYGKNVMAFYVKADTNNRVAKQTGKSRDYTLMKNGDLLIYSPEQIKSAIDNIGTFDGSNPDTLYSDPADDEKSDRQILAAALMSTAQNEVERNALTVYQRRVKKLDAMSQRLAEVNEEIRSMMFQRGARDEAYKQRLDALKTEKDKLERSISQGDSKLLTLEATRSLQGLLERERQRTAKLWIDAGRKQMNNYRERNLVRMYADKIEDKAKNLRKMLLENSDKYHIPDAFKTPVASFLSLLDFSSERVLAGGDPTKHDQELQQKFEEVRELLESIANENSDEFLQGLDLPPDAVDAFVELAKEVAQMAIEGQKGGAMVLRRMSSEQLKTLNTTLYAMTRAVRQANELFATERFRHVSELSLDAIGAWEEYASKGKRSKVSDFLTWENLTPYYAFRRLGKAGEALFNGFRKGQSDFAFLAREVMDFTEKLYTKDEVRAWSRQVHTFKSEQGEFYMTTAQIMTLYELWKDKDAKQHLLGGGVRIEDIALGAKKKYTNDANGTTLNELLVDEILSKLTVRQKAVADGLQKFMAERCAEWGNEISYKRWGIKLFGLDYYFPIESDRNTVASDVSQKAKENGLFTLLHKSFTKKRVFRANNRIMIRSAFDVFASHSTEMAKYKSFALPLLDMQKFINFKEIVTREQTAVEAYKEAITNWDGNDNGGYFALGDTSDALARIGVTKNKIYFDQSKAKKAMVDHPEVTKKVLQGIPELLQRPIVIAESYDDTVLIYGELYDEKGNPVMVALRMDCNSRANDGTTVNKIRSVGVRMKSFDKYLAEQNILYLDENKKRTDTWFQALGRSTPFGGNKYGSIRSIPHSNQNVNALLSIEEKKDTSYTTKEVRASMEKAFGTAAYQYIEQFLIDLNGSIGGRSAAESVLQRGITAHKIAAVGANLRVALLQPTAYVRALNVLEPKYFFGGLKAVGHLPSCIRKMEKYSGIALWKSLGYRDANIGAPLQTKIKHDEGWKDKLVEKSMILAELGDKVTWGALWYACELEIRDKQSNLKVGSEEYYAAVAERFEEIIYSTQVVDSVFTKSQLMRRKDFFATLFSSFMSEPTLSYNLLASNALELMDKKRRGGKLTKQDAKPFVRAVGVFAIGAVIQAAFESVIDAARGMGEDEEEYPEKYWSEFASNVLQEIVPLNLVPVIKDVWGIALSTIRGDYMSSSRIDLEVYNRLGRAVKAIGKMFEDGEVSYTNVHKILSAISSLTGLPISNLIRDIVAIWNAVMGSIDRGLILE